MSEVIDELGVDELEQLLLEAYEDNTDEDSKSIETNSDAVIAQPKSNLTIEGSSFLQGDTDNIASKESNQPPVPSLASDSLRDTEVDSSDDEDTRNFLERKYNQYGRQINDLLKSKEAEKTDQALSKWVDKKLWQINRATAQPAGTVRSLPETEEIATKATERDKPKMFSSPKTVPKSASGNAIPAAFEATVHTDPIFGLRIVHPLVSSQTLLELMQGKKPVPFMRIRNFVETADLEQDWVIGGVLVSKSPTKTTAKGKQFAVWKLSDLHGDIKMVSLFLFGSAYKDLWKTADGTAIAVLNPNVLNGNSDRKSEAALSIDRASKVMVLGKSRDLGKCRSRKKNGERCRAIVNLGKYLGEYCVYHIKQEYGKACNRGGLLTSTGGQGLNQLRNKVLGKNEVFYGGQSFSAIKAVKHPKQVEKDRQRMLTLSDYYRSPFEGNEGASGSSTAGSTGGSTGVVASNSAVGSSSSSSVPAYRQVNATLKGSAANVEMNVGQRMKDMQRLQSLGVSLDSLKSNQATTSSPRPSSTDQLNASSSTIATQSSSVSTTSNSFVNRKFSLESVPRLSRSSFDIELTTTHMSAAKALHSRARATAILKQKPIEKSNPNFIKYRGTEQGKKRVLEEVAKNTPADENVAKRQKVQDDAECARKEHMKRIIEATSSHKDLVVARENEHQEEYFKTLERKEAMEEQMLNTFKVACKAVSCRQCKYIAFTAADRCKTEGHQLRVHDAEKRFFRCADCGGRTVTLFRIPKVSCKACQGSRWERCAMMREKRGVQIGDVLSIRGDEEKYLGSLAGASASLNLLMPEEN